MGLLLVAAPALSQPEEERDGFLDSITVTTTRGERGVGEVTGTVSVIDSATIGHRLMTDTADLTRNFPGVYVATSGTRYGSGGFNIRGVGGNRVLTQIDGVTPTRPPARGRCTAPTPHAPRPIRSPRGRRRCWASRCSTCPRRTS